MTMLRKVTNTSLTRRDLGVTGLAAGAAALIKPDEASAAGPILRGLEDLKEGAETDIAWVRAMQAYVYGFPLVIMDLTRKVTTATATSGDYAAPINQWGRMRTPVRWDFNNVVRISVSSLWSFAFLDLANGPLVMTLPDCKNIHFAFRVLNHWTDVFATAGTRTPDVNAGNYVIAGPGWEGTAPSNIKKVFRSSTRYAWALVEMAAAGPQDYPTIHALQDQLQATPLDAWGASYTPPASVPVDPNVDLTATPYDQVRLMTGERFFKELARLMKDNPPYPGDTAQIDRLKKLGIEPGKEFDPSKINPAVRKGINDAPAEVWKKFATGPYGMTAPNGWINMLNIARFGSDYQTRAYVAYMGLGAGVAEDIVYPSAFVDGDGNALDGAYNYVMHFDKADLGLSQNGVWSISAYRENFYVHNSLERYGLLQSMPKYNADGSLDVYLQAKSPGADKESNWLPIPPSGMFNLTIRIYDPKQEALSESHKFQPVKKVGAA
jgi:hypothetical protein